MAYTSGTLSELAHVIGGRGKYWSYVTADDLATVGGAGYVSDAGKKRLNVGDVIFVLAGTLSTLIGASPSLVSAGVTSEFASGAAVTWQPYVVASVSAVDSKGVPTQAATATLAPAVLAGLQNNPRNLIDAGDATTNPWSFGTAQRTGGSSAVLVTDRFAAIGGASSSWNTQRSANTDIAGFSQAFQWGRSSTDTHTTGLTFGQVMESVDSIRVQGLPVSMSMWVKAGANFAAGASAGTFRMQLIAGTGTDDTFANLAAGSWTGATTVATATVTPGTATTRVGPFTGTVPTNATQLAWLVTYNPSAGTTAGANEWLQMLGIQSEVGGMTPYEHLDVAEVLNIATRYLQVINEPTAGIAVGPAVFSASSIAQVHIPLIAPMRKAPTVTFTAGGWAITDSALGAHTISSGGGTTTTPAALTMTVTAATTLTAGLVSMLQGRTTGSGIIIANADYA